ncbi:polysaccharide biosynthesis family protein [Paraburkholderia xenovorans LB400]|jgi:O-antigen/teichoic acid export membrane protein|uniref:O-antigen exporter/flippase, PST family, MOP superfamily n=1 Tax=Paraburkholderia xenovorans (strain LB400) TaxID=266265 RepID=Q144H4_PARXL|nr:oligosaccharide flippase family protein [Paraburkholderia xenovorans]ABE29265.1 O-antigen exporter/flippase, PST family, MOP superfamily [Paraburkholderia xenovorans LB400]AIP31774.1 polysaccharide biosynthesis family protein [Paraburkholderia xenovorans LB400]EIF32791.1 membrane protein involved in the export of O-antigen and teichoic acid [Burkholderia sp. Ch1-1]NPT38196.1 oligosaccharide flippase family protein [Paraburkholderia xenovorans]
MLRRTLLANFAGQMVTALLGIVMVPIYVRHLGVEAYGLIAINAVVLAWVLVLDFGLSPTLCRELGSLRAGTGVKAEVGLLLESLEKLILGTSTILFVLSIFIAPYFAERWLNASTLPPSEIRTAFVLMMLTAIARWLGALYRGGVVGIDRQVALNGIVITFAVIRTVFVVPIIMIWPRIEFFFVWQLLAIVTEAVAMRTLLARAIDIPFLSTRFSWKVLSSRAKLSMSIALATVIWACTTQIDKIVLSKLLPLADFAVFSLATLLASGILLLANPIQQAFIPRLTTESFGGGERIRQMYALATELTSLAVIPVAAVFICAPEAVLRFWSASAPLSPEAVRTMQCYAAGNAFSAIASLAFIVQYAKGDLSLHLKGIIGFLILYAPAVLFGGMHFGAVGAAYAWLGMNFLLLFGWVAIVHRKFIAGINASWYRGLIARIAALAPVGLLLSRADLTNTSRIGLFFVLSGAWLAMVALTIAVSPIIQRKARHLAGRLAFN